MAILQLPLQDPVQNMTRKSLLKTELPTCRSDRTAQLLTLRVMPLKMEQDGSFQMVLLYSTNRHF